MVLPYILCVFVERIQDHFIKIEIMAKIGESKINPSAAIVKSEALFTPRCMLPMASVCVALLIVYSVLITVLFKVFLNA